MLLKSQHDKTVHLQIEIENICPYPIPKGCKLITRDEKCNILILNPEINNNEVITIKEKKKINLNLKFKEKNKININENYFEFALHSESFGLISKWEKIYIFVKDDSENIEKINK
jgi:hypothetical protein